jgi:hypothetical protein
LISHYQITFDRTIAAGMAANAPWTVLNYPRGHHGFDVLDDNDLSREIIEETFRFVQLAISDSHQSALPAPPAPPAAVPPVFVTPHENETTSISSLCLSSSDSPLMSPIFAKMSDAIEPSLRFCTLTDDPTQTQQPRDVDHRTIAF